VLGGVASPTRVGSRGDAYAARAWQSFPLTNHDANWEEPLLKQIRHLRKMTMKAEAARAEKRLKHAVAALSAVGTFAG
jgi:hypothetical protein